MLSGCQYRDPDNLTEPPRSAEIPTLEDAYELHGGMPRSALTKNFRAEDGLNTVPASRYVHKNCNLVKVDVKFARAKKAMSTQSSLGDEPIIESNSEPYADMPVSD
jgi:hypothetical protein